MYDILWWQQSDVLVILPFFVEDTHFYLPACSLFWHTYGRPAIDQTRGGDRGFEPLHGPPRLLNPPTHVTSKYLQERRWEMRQKKNDCENYVTVHGPVAGPQFAGMSVFSLLKSERMGVEAAFSDCIREVSGSKFLLSHAARTACSI
jgi:hypothetical protein